MMERRGCGDPPNRTRGVPSTLVALSAFLRPLLRPRSPEPAPGVAGGEEEDCGPHYECRAVGEHVHGDAGQAVGHVPVTRNGGIAQLAESGGCGHGKVRFELLVDAYV